VSIWRDAESLSVTVQNVNLWVLLRLLPDTRDDRQSLGSTRLLRNLLFGVAPTDPLTFALAAATTGCAEL